MQNEKKSVSTSGYFLTTLLFFTFVPNLLLVGFAVLVFTIYGLLGIDGTAFFVVGFVLDAALMGYLSYRWGRKRTVTTEKRAVPERVGVVYLPAVIPLLFQLVVSAVFAAGFPVASAGMKTTLNFINAAFTFDLAGGAVAALRGIPIVLGHLGANAVNLAGFAVGERLAAKKDGAVRLRGGTPARAVYAVTAAVAALGFGCGWYLGLASPDMTKNEVYEEMEANRGYDPEYRYYDGVMGYGFPYENGWSSVDLSSYYVENPQNKLALTSAPPTLVITDPEKMPRLDGAEAAYPVYSAFANACYANIAEIQTAEKAKLTPENHHYTTYSRGNTPVCFTNTIEAFKGLVDGDVDIFFGARPSAAQQKLAEDAGKTLVLTPIGKEAFVFMVSRSNPVNGLSSEQIRGIYSGRYSNWLSVGGLAVPIMAFQRPENSGSQTMMKYFMGDTELKKPLEVEYVGGMGMTIRSIATYQNKLSAIGYSFRYYATKMDEEDGKGVKLLSLDGVYPDEEHISSGEYPMTTALYAITLAENDNEYIAPMLEWMTGGQGQEIVEKTGYVAVN